MKEEYENKSQVLRRLKNIEMGYRQDERITHKNLMDKYKSGIRNLKPTPVEEQVINCMDVDEEVQELKAWLEGYKVAMKRAVKTTRSVAGRKGK